MKLDLIIVWQFVTAGSLIGFVLIEFFLNAWLFGGLDVSAEDGCEGTPSEGRSLMGKLGGILFGK